MPNESLSPIVPTGPSGKKFIKKETKSLAGAVQLIQKDRFMTE